MTKLIKTILLGAGIGFAVAGCITQLDVKVPDGKGYILYHEAKGGSFSPKNPETKITCFPDSTKKDSSEVFYDYWSNGIIGNDNLDYYSKTIVGNQFRQYQNNKISFEDGTVFVKNGIPVCDSVVASSRKVLEDATQKYLHLKEVVFDSLLNRAKVR
jgi:hypothetical protein